MAPLAVRVVVERASLALVYRLSEALEAAEMESTRALLIERLSAGQAIETTIARGCVRAVLQPFAELMLLEIVAIAERPALPVATRARLAQRVMQEAGYV